MGLSLLVLVGLYVWISHFRLDPLDEGYFAYTSSRVLAGDLPYRDFSTPYTPAFFYLNATLFRLFGLDLLTLRLSLVLARVAILLVMYVLGRRIMPPAFALLPIGIQMIEDQAPSVWESHPAWWATLAALLSVWCICRHRERGGAGWWLAAGLSVGVAFAFKQNVGLFALVALMGVALSEARDLPPLRAPTWLGRLALPVPSAWVVWFQRLAGPLYIVGLCFGVSWGLRQHLDPATLAMFAAPFIALAIIRLKASQCGGVWLDGQAVAQQLAATRTRLGLTGLGFILATLPWLLALVVALGPSQTPLGAFLGAIDSGGYYLALEPVRPQLVAVLGLIVLVPGLVWMLARPRPGWLKLLVAAGGLALAAGCGWDILRTAPLVEPRPLRAFALLTVDAAFNFVLYAPSLAFWAAFGILLARPRPAAESFNLRWYLLAGSLLLLNQYPRMDETHLLFSGPLLWIVGAYALWRLYAQATRSFAAGRPGQLWRTAFYLGLLGLPIALTWPTIEARREDLIVRTSGGLLRLRTPTYEPLDLPGAGVSEIVDMAWKYRTIAAYFRERSRPGDRIFVYPAAPLFYYLLDRPNATRFNHVFPGLLSPADEQETISRLGSVPATYVIWDSFGATYWGEPGVYQRLTDYIWEQYVPVESIGGFEIMRRRS